MSETITSEITTSSESHLEKAIQHYKAKLDRLESSKVTETSIYEVLLARDAVENLLPERFEELESCLVELVELDLRLKSHRDAIATTPNLENWKTILNPPETAWWWQFTPTPVITTWDKLDELWNTMTLVCLTVVGSLMLNITSAMSAGGAVQWPQTLMTLLQGTGLALVAGGTFTSAGQTQVEKLLERMNITPELRAEATLGMAISLVLVSIGIYNVLPKYLFYLGTQNYNEGNLSQALIRLTQATEMQPDNLEMHIALGKVYESLDNTAEAMAEYATVLPSGSPEAFNAAGRLQINAVQEISSSFPEKAEALLRLGLQRAYIKEELGLVKEEESVDMRYRLRTNLGWALLEQERYEHARQELLEAIEFNKQFPDKRLGSGMAQCFLIKANLALGNKTEAMKNWSACLRESHPEFLSEYEWVIDNGYSHLATCLDTNSIVVGLEHVNVPKLVSKLKVCQQPPESLFENRPTSTTGE